MSKTKIQRNARCPCGSGKKYKQCCALLVQEPGVPADIPHDSIQTEFALALAAFNDGRLTESAAITDSILELDPRQPEALHLRGLVDFRSGDFPAAVGRIKAAILLNPSESRYFYNLGTALLGLNNHTDAIEQFLMVIQLDPKNADAHGNLAAALHFLGRYEEAKQRHLSAIEMRPEDAGVLSNYAATLNANSEFKEAIPVLVKALSLNPDHVDALNNIGLSAQRTGMEAEAETFFRRAVELNPLNATAHFNLADTMQNQSRLEEAIQSCRDGLVLRPSNAVAHSNLLLHLQYSLRITPQEMFDEHLRFAKQFEDPLKASRVKHVNSREPEKRLRVGYVSADFRNHAVASFIAPILQHHDAEQVDVHCYHNHGVQDSVTERLMSFVPHWIPCFDMSDEQLADRIRADGIDILIDLSGHTSGNRLLMLARKPAPLQVSWIGYPGTTGLDAMDYFVAERFWLPVGELDDQFSEKLVRLPATSTFMPHFDAPDVNPLPALSNGYLTFGSFNATHKINVDVVSLWSQLLRALPDARMLVGAVAPGVAFDGLIKMFAEQGVVRERLQFHRRCHIDEYMALHHQVDFCLDTFPYSGGTTTAHALWMGVPTLTLAGWTPAGRQGCGLPLHVDAEAFVANDAAAFVRQGVLLANDLPGLALLRSQLRERFSHSAACDPALITTSLEQALRTMWQRWCAGMAPERFEVSPHSTQSNAAGECSKLD